jgi:hypothetical protein
MPNGGLGYLTRLEPYSFKGTFSGPRINAEYGRPVVVRFTNLLDQNPLGLDRQDFGSPDWAALTHLHNAHTARWTSCTTATLARPPLPCRAWVAVTLERCRRAVT